MSNKKFIFDKINALKTPNHQLARESLFLYSMVFNMEVEPNHDYADKFFTILSSEFSDFQESEDSYCF